MAINLQVAGGGRKKGLRSLRKVGQVLLLLLIWEAVTWQFSRGGTLLVFPTTTQGYYLIFQQHPQEVTALSNLERGDKNNDDNEDWFDKERWESHAGPRSCYVAENVCHSSQRFFYDSALATSHRLDYPQEDVVLEFNKAFTNSRAYPPHGIVIEKNITLSNADLNRCNYSPIRNHMILHALHNQMLLEYYVRTNYWLQMIMMIATDGDDNKKFKRQTQLYLKMYEGPSQAIYDGHYLFSEFATSNPLLNFRSLLDYNGCRCMRRVLFCGFHETVIQKPTSPTNTIATTENNNYSSDQNQTTVTTTRQIRLSPRGEIGWHVRPQSMPTDFYQQLKETTLVQDLIRDNPFIHSEIQKYRQTSLQLGKSKRGENFRGYHGQDDWKLIGLVQRSKRRSWSNMDQVVASCNERFQGEKLRCIVVNIELPEWSTPTKHLIAHAGVDVLIGVHGSSLTNAVLLPPGGLVVELLPWIKAGDKNGWGWARGAEAPTIVGIIFSNTNINHIGYPLGLEESVYALCEQGNDERCHRNSASRKWQDRDFVVPSERVLDIIEKFVISKNNMDDNQKPKTTTCVDYQEASGDDYILYNINCQNEKGHMEIQHHYREKGWLESKS